ncbi:hypothetical protein ACBB95_004383 [Salmonella enterica]
MANAALLSKEQQMSSWHNEHVMQFYRHRIKKMLNSTNC